MVKQRMHAIDIKAAAAEISAAVVGMRLINLYDVTPRVYLLKFGAGDRKTLVLVEVGVRVHITTYSREKPRIPSQFTLKLRKHVRSWRLDAVEQLGIDRAMNFRFGSGDSAFHFIIELYGKGNFVLTDHTFTILMLLRTRKDDDVKLAVKERYPVEGAQQLPLAPPTVSEVEAALGAAGETVQLRTVVCDTGKGAFVPAIVEHALLLAQLDPTAARSSWGSPGAECTFAEAVTAAVADCWRLHRETPSPGGVLFARCGGGAGATAAEAVDAAVPAAAAASDATAAATIPSILARQNVTATFDDFSPMHLAQYDQFKESTVIRTRSFCEVVDRFFLPFEMTKIDEHNVKKETAVEGKKNKFFRDHQRRIDELTNEEEKNRRKGELILLNTEEVEEAIEMVNMALGSGITWENLSGLLRLRRREGLPVAQTIHDLHLERSSIDLLLMEEVSEASAENDGDVAPIVVEVDINLNPFENATRYFQKKKANTIKLEKTINATDKAAAAAAKKGQRVAVKQGPAKRELHVERTRYFFEKFYWFIASTGHLVLCAKDAQQADDLVRRYMEPGDLFVHCDLHGAPPCIVKAVASRPMYEATLLEAGTMAVCRSSAWDSKQPVSAWWVYASQVSKTPPDGSFLPSGVFHVRGRKNFLQAMPLTLGVGIVFRASTTQEWTAPEDSEPIQADDPSTHSPPIRPSTTEAPAMCRQPSGTSESCDESSSPPISASTASKSPNTSRPPHAAFPSTAAMGGAALKKLSAKERLRQRGAAGAAASATGDSCDSATTLNTPETLNSGTPETRSTATSRSQSSSAANGAKVAAAAMPKSRRQLNKLKKINRKYGEQDEEDRQRAMQLLGSKPCRAQQLALSVSSRARKAGSEEDTSDDGCCQGGGSKARVKGGTAERHTAVKGGASEEDTGDDARRVTFASKADIVEVEHESMRRRMASFEDAEASRRERMRHELGNEMPHLTTSPPADAQVGFAMIVCAPFSTLMSARFRLEITPGTEKKGAAAKQVLHHFQTAAADLARTSADPLNHTVAQLLKLVKDEELVLQLVAPCKVHLRAAARDVTTGVKQSKRAAGDGRKTRSQQHADPHE